MADLVVGERVNLKASVEVVVDLKVASEEFVHKISLFMLRKERIMRGCKKLFFFLQKIDSTMDFTDFEHLLCQHKITESQSNINVRGKCR